MKPIPSLLGISRTIFISNRTTSGRLPLLRPRIRHCLSLSVLLGFMFVAACPSARAQLAIDPTLERGMKPYGSFEGGDIDSISMTNGNLNLHLPLASYPQRGGKLNVSFSIKFDNNSYTYTPDTASACNQKPFVCGYGTFVNGPLMEIVPNVNLYASVTGTIPPSTGPYAIITTADGSEHEMGPVSGGWRTLDATGFLCLSNCATVIDRNGIRYTGATGGSQALKIEDPNGNYLTATLNGAVVTGYVDTMHRTLPIPPAVGTGGTGFTTDTSGCTGLPAVTAYDWTLPAYLGGTFTIKICYADIYFGEQTCLKEGSTVTCGVTLQKTPLIDSIVLPNNTAWTFTYDSANPNITGSTGTGNLLQITFPTGGYIQYSWTGIYVCQTDLDTGSTTYTYAVASRTVNANDGTGNHTWKYAFENVPLNTTKYTTTSTDPLGQKTVHTISAEAGLCAFYETETQTYTAAGSLLKTVATVFNAAGDPMTLTGLVTTAANVVPTSVTTTWANNQVSELATAFDAGVAMTAPVSGFKLLYGNPVTKQEYDYGSGTHGSLLRTTTTAYQAFNSSSYLANNLLALPASVTIAGGSQSEITDYGYDETAVVSSGVTTQHDSSPPDGTIRGNQTSVSRYLNASTVQTTGCPVTISSGYVKTKFFIYDTGETYQSIDPCSNVTTFGYSGTFDGAYLTQTTLPATGGVQHVTSTNYDFDSGLVTSTTDQNGNVTSFTYDVLWRLASVTYPPPAGSQITITRQETSFPFSATSTQTATPSPSIVKTNVFDGLGRVSESQLNSAPACVSKVDTTYDALGRKASVSNPYCSTADPTYGITQYSYDALDRTTVITDPDSKTIQFNYAGSATQTLDEGNGGTQPVSRISQVDGLGRTVSVCEVSGTTQLGSGKTPVACGQAIAGTGFLTTYSYDVLNDMLSVSQGGFLPRSFTYDSLSQLTHATNPESGAISYAYDADGNVISRTAPEANQTSGGTATDITTMTYDALNRLTAKSYSQSLNTVSFAYDATTVSNGIGRMTFAIAETPKVEFFALGKAPTGDVLVTMDVSSEIFSYDAMGRIIDNSQCTPENCPSGDLPVKYTYDLAGHTTSMTNGAGVTLAETYDGADRVTSLASSLDGAQYPSPLISNMTYNAPGEEVSASLGNGLNETAAYDKRTRITSFAAGSMYNYSLTYEPNSDIATANDSVNSNWTYTYDAFNRLSTSSSAAQSYSYVYDRFGNRWQQNVTGGTGLQSTLTFMGVGLTGTTNKADTYSYDPAGNLLNDGVNSYLYDDENRIVQVTGGGITTIYVYDALGRRVEKYNSAAALVDYVNDLDGNKITELNSSGVMQRGELFAGGRHIATYWNGTTYFDHTDWLGSERARTDYQGNLYETCTSLPFGDGLTCSNTDPSPLHFTGKERDSESGLDNFGARYNSSQYGRFMSPDPMGGKRIDPQTLNKYSYVRNNPLNLTDPTGLYIVDCTDGSTKDRKNCNKASDRFEKQRDKDLNSKDVKVRDAAKAWGDRGEDNHVNVTFKSQRQVDADANTQPGYKTDAIVTPGATSDHQPNINAEFSENLGGKDLAQTIAHEGSHLEDDMNFLKSFDATTAQYNGALNFTHFDTEFQAFEAGSMVKSYEMFPSGPKGYQQLTNYIYRAYPSANQLVFPPSIYPQGNPPQ